MVLFSFVVPAYAPFMKTCASFTLVSSFTSPEFGYALYGPAHPGPQYDPQYGNLNHASPRMRGGSELVAHSIGQKAIRQRMLGLVKHNVVRARYGHHDHEPVPVILNFAAELRSLALQFSDRV